MPQPTRQIPYARHLSQTDPAKYNWRETTRSGARPTHNHGITYANAHVSKQDGALLPKPGLRGTEGDRLPEGASASEPVARLDGGAGGLLVGSCLATAGAPGPAFPDVLPGIAPFKSVLCCGTPICEC